MLFFQLILHLIQVANLSSMKLLITFFYYCFHFCRIYNGILSFILLLLICIFSFVSLVCLDIDQFVHLSVKSVIRFIDFSSVHFLFHQFLFFIIFFFLEMFFHLICCLFHFLRWESLGH